MVQVLFVTRITNPRTKHRFGPGNTSNIYPFLMRLFLTPVGLMVAISRQMSIGRTTSRKKVAGGGVGGYGCLNPLFWSRPSKMVIFEQPTLNPPVGNSYYPHKSNKGGTTPTPVPFSLCPLTPHSPHASTAAWPNMYAIAIAGSPPSLRWEATILAHGFRP